MGERVKLFPMSTKCSQVRLSEASARARDAEARGDDKVAGEEWRRYRLIRDANRDPDDLLTEGIALSAWAIKFAAERRSNDGDA
jgi:hypothetical protein